MQTMNGTAFRRGFEKELVAWGFELVGSTCRRRSEGVWTLIGTAPGFGRRWHVNVGFWLEALADQCPSRVELTHLYFRLEGLFPDHLDLIVLAGSLDAPTQPEAYGMLIEIFRREILSRLDSLGSEAGLRKAMSEGKLANGLVRREARNRLLGPS